MSLKARLAVVDQPAAPATFTCADYDAPPGSKRCRSYLGNGGCAREDHFMCEEWMKANGHAVPAPVEAKLRARSRPLRQRAPRGAAAEEASRRPHHRHRPSLAGHGASQQPNATLPSCAT